MAFRILKSASLAGFGLLAISASLAPALVQNGASPEHASPRSPLSRPTALTSLRQAYEATESAPTGASYHPLTATTILPTSPGCFAEESGLPPADAVAGRLLLRTALGLRALDLASGRRYLLATLPVGSAFIYDSDAIASPDGRWVAYIQNSFDVDGRLKTRTLHLVNKSGYSLDMSSWPEQWQWILGWLDNRRLLLWRPHLGTNRVTVLNPFDGATRELDYDLPSFAPTTWDFPAWVLYNSRLDRVAFTSGEWGMGISVTEPSSGRLLWTGATYEKPQWSPDGSMLAVAYQTCEGCTALIVIDTDGQVTWLVDPTDPNSNADFVDLRGLAWSPDGHHLAVWAAMPSEDCCYIETWHLLIVDVRAREFIDTCLRHDGYLVARPLWSPDGKWVSVEHWRELPGWDWRAGTALLDVQGGRVFELLGAIGPLAWSADN